jgi:hypothetical protein
MNNKTFGVIIKVDGHSSRLGLSLWEEVKSLNINILSIPGHTNDVTQP